MAALTTASLLLFMLVVLVPLLPPRLVDPFWQLSFTAALSSNGIVVLLAVWLVHLAAALDPQAAWLQRRQQRLARLCRWLVFAFLLLIPLQGLAVWRVMHGGEASAQRTAPLQRSSRQPQPLAAGSKAPPLKDDLRVVLSSLGLALVSAATSQSPGRPLGLLAKARWRSAQRRFRSQRRLQASSPAAVAAPSGAATLAPPAALAARGERRA